MKTLKDNSFSFRSYRSKFTSVPEVITAMENLQEELENTDMENLRAFNQTYLTITKNVFARMGTGYFANDHLMTEVDIQFSRYYFNALKAYLSGRKSPEAWKVLFDSCKANRHNQFVYMAMGVNAHVNNDLAFTLVDVVSDEAFQQDFLKVNEIIHQSTKDIILSLEEKSSLVSFVENNFLILYKYFLDKLIENWRANVWKNYLNLKKGSTKKEAVEEKAFSIVKSLSNINHLSKLYLLHKTMI